MMDDMGDEDGDESDSSDDCSGEGILPPARPAQRNPVSTKQKRKKERKPVYRRCQGNILSPLESLMLNGPSSEVEERISDIVISERRWIQQKKHMIQKLRMKRREEVSLDDLSGPTDEELLKIEGRMAKYRGRSGKT